VAEVNAAGTELVYAGYIGGSDLDYGYGIAVDGMGNAYVTGDTYSTEAQGFPVAVGPDLTHNGGGENPGDAFVAKVSGAVPYPPVLKDIQNSGGNYAVEWTYDHTDAPVITYTLQEATDVAFTANVVIYSTSGTSYPFAGRTCSTYYYRVRGNNEYVPGEWSNVESVSVGPCYVYLPAVLKEYRTWDAYYEENDHWLDAYGPLVSDRTYLAYPNDVEDYYYFVLSATATVNVSVTDFAPTSSNGTVMLYGPAVGSERGNLIEYYGPPGQSSMSLGPHSLGPGKYYVRVNTAKDYSTTQLYHLTVTY